MRKGCDTQPAITCSKLTIKTPERLQWRRPGVSIFIGNFEHISHLILLFLLLTLSKYMPAGIANNSENIYLFKVILEALEKVGCLFKVNNKERRQ